VDDLGQPISYLILEPGAAVLSSDGEKLGRVKEIRADTEKDIFDAIAVERGMLIGDQRLVLAEQVVGIYEQGVVLKLDAGEYESLPEPG